MSVFQTTLYLSNLPTNIQRTHLAQILSRPPPTKNDDRRQRLRDPGICMIQIYTLPPTSSSSHSRVRTKKNTKRHSKSERQAQTENRARLLWKLHTLINQLFCLSSSSMDSMVDTPRSSVDEDEGKPLPIVPGGAGAATGDVRTTTREVDIQEEEEQDELPVRIDSRGGEKTIAYIHFRTEAHLYRAQKMLGSVIIDGRPIKVTRKRFNSGLVKRIFTKTKN